MRYKPALFMAALVASTVSGFAQDEHKMLKPDQLQWGPAKSLPAGAQVVVMYGDPGKESAFALRVKLPANYKVPPHTHPKPEVLTVVSGTFQLGMGEMADKNKAEPLPAGSFVTFPASTPHFAFTDEETVIQLNSIGPWGITYVNPKDDPRQTQ
jgi:quercetin dioxygenase-like cupin family protein